MALKKLILSYKKQKRVFKINETVKGVEKESNKKNLMLMELKNKPYLQIRKNKILLRIKQKKVIVKTIIKARKDNDSERTSYFFKKKYLSQREKNIEAGKFYLMNTFISLKKRFDLGLQEFLGCGATKSLRFKARVGENLNRNRNFLNWVKKYSFLEGFLFYNMYYREAKLGERDRFSTYVRDFYRSRIKALQKAKSYRSMRHMQFLPVRGQRTRTNAQTQKSKRKNRKKIPIPKKKK
jgi:hypothetical protein